ncbi:MAG TPA: type II toxin-antitoxin system ParD family antitoxin [Pyrinomonadaceae bacterium]|nr:type II toxin-antitoxin system ParD family antitoxin [Pyrinomonadaceae bacterium]
MARKIINISVPPKLQTFIEYRVESGRYASVSEYFRDLLKRDEEREIARLEEADRRRSMPPGREQPIMRRH